MTINKNLLIAATLFASSSAMAGDFSLGAGLYLMNRLIKGITKIPPQYR
jgi:outer membrane protein